MTRLEKGSQIATIIALPAIVIALWISIGALIATDTQITQSTSALNALKQIISQNNDLLKNQSKLVELQIQQLTLTEEAINQTQQKTILETYLAEGDHSVTIENCTYDNQSNSINYNVAVLTDKQKPSLLSFFVNMKLAYYVNDNNQNTVALGWIPAFTKVLQPVSYNWYRGVPIYQILQENNQTNYSELYVRSQYSYAPYSDIGNTVILHPTRDTVGQLLMGFKKDQNNNWQRMTTSDNSNIICK